MFYLKQFSDNLFCVTGGFASAPVFIVVKNDKELLLIDTGMSKDVTKVTSQIEERFGSLDKIKTIVFTHRHYDHTGGLSKLLEKIGKKVEIISHKDEEPLFNEDFKDRGIKITKTIKHNDYIDKKLKIKAIHTPGHTFGHLCFLFENEKLLLTGDLFMNTLGRLAPVFKTFHDDFSKWKETVPTILAYDWDFAIPSHMQIKKIPREKIEKFI